MFLTLLLSVWFWVGVVLAYAGLAVWFFKLARRNKNWRDQKTSDLLFWVGCLGCTVSVICGFLGVGLPDNFAGSFHRGRPFLLST